MAEFLLAYTICGNGMVKAVLAARYRPLPHGRGSDLDRRPTRKFMRGDTIGSMTIPNVCL